MNSDLSCSARYPCSKLQKRRGTVDTTNQFLSRPEIRALKQRVRQQADADAAIDLLADSVRKGHRRLALHRFFVALSLDESRANCFVPYCTQIAASLPTSEVQTIVNHANREFKAMRFGSLGDDRD